MKQFINEYVQTLASKVNRPYANITLDVGAAINAYKYAAMTTHATMTSLIPW